MLYLLLAVNLVLLAAIVAMISYSLLTAAPRLKGERFSDDPNPNSERS